MHLRIASWNINSVRLRIDQVARFATEHTLDVLCLQEIKCEEGQFPYEAFYAMGFPHVLVMGQKGWHGVALASKLPFDVVGVPPFCRRGEARAQSIHIDIGGPHPLEIWNFYIPAGGDNPDRFHNDKFDHKLEFYERMSAHLLSRNPDHPLLVCGDLNIAPGEFDVWSHRQMLRVVSHTPAEIEAFAVLMQAGGFHDPFRALIPEPEKIFTWWSYRAADFRKSNRGLRLDHILLNPALMQRVTTPIAARVHDTVREWERPSDHVPISVDFDI
ncbi:MAG: exodeoxyribonuclease III [Asticcacaulis sp.]